MEVVSSGPYTLVYPNIAGGERLRCKLRLDRMWVPPNPERSERMDTNEGRAGRLREGVDESHELL